MEPGERIGERYEVERPLGGGGMGRVYAARHLELGTTVAIKVLSANALSDPIAIERFEREARIVARLHTEHVARVLDFGRLPTGQPYLVMERLKGRDLGGSPGLSSEALVDAILGACDAIAEAHALGIVHRDLKPSNLFLADQPDGTSLVKVLDFGIAKAALPEGEGASLTGSGDVFGSPMYMSPEQLRATATVDRRTDIWSLGAILFELLSGKPPYHVGTVAEIWNAILSRPVPPLEPRIPAPPGLSAVVARCLEKDPAARYQSVGELAAALQPFSSGSAEARRAVERALRFQEGRTSLASLTGEAHRLSGTLSPAQAPSRARPSSAVAVGGVALLVGLGALFLWGRRAPADDRPAAASSPPPPPASTGAPTARAPVPAPTVLAAPTAAPSAILGAAPEVRPSAKASQSPANAASSARAPARPRDPFATPD